MKLFALISLFAVLFFATSAISQCVGACIFYGGDFDPNDPNANALANENDAIVGGNPYGAATYQNFVINFNASINGLFTNDLMDASITVPPTANAGPGAYWEIRSGVSEGNGGTLIASGSRPDKITPTGRSDFGYTEYRNEVGDFDVHLSPGTYWFAVVPQAANQREGRSFNSDTDGLHSVGTQISNDQFFNSAFFGANFTNANNEGGFRTFSSGVYSAFPEPSAIPEPSSLILLGSGLLAAVSVVRRRRIGR